MKRFPKRFFCVFTSPFHHLSKQSEKEGVKQEVSGLLAFGFACNQAFTIACFQGVVISSFRAFRKAGSLVVLKIFFNSLLHHFIILHPVHFGIDTDLDLQRFFKLCRILRHFPVFRLSGIRDCLIA